MIRSKLIGQEKNLEMLSQQIQEGKLSNAYLIKGVSGLGKKELAKTLAQATVCETHTACGECIECRRFLTANHPNIKYIKKDGASIKVDQIREINEFISKKSFNGQPNIILIEDAENMNVAAQNALLKNLEEPQNAVFILTANTATLLPTIVSRSVLIKPFPVKENVVFDILKENHPDWDTKKLTLGAKYSKGNVGLAMKLNEDFFELRRIILSKLISKSLNWEFRTAEEMKDKSIDEITTLLLILQSFFRDIYVYKTTGKEELVANIDFLTDIKNHSNDGYDTVKIIDKSIGYIQNTNVNKTMLLVNLFLSL